MKAEWMFDARKIPDEVMDHLRRIAVRAVEEKNYSPELVADCPEKFPKNPAIFSAAART